MSLEAVLTRIAQIESLAAAPLSGGASSTPVASAASASGSTFANMLGSATSSGSAQAAALDAAYGTQALSALAGDGVQSGTGSATLSPASDLLSLLGSGAFGSSSSSALGTSGVTSSSYPGVSAGGNQQIVQIAESQVGQSEQPPGSNGGPAVAMYASAVAGAQQGEPWCAYFASWVGRQAGLPLGAQGQGLGAVSDIWSWAQQTGRAIPNGPGVVPQPGDLIVFGDQHVGIVVGVQANGDIDTVEGNYDNQVMRNVRSPTEATGYVNMSS